MEKTSSPINILVKRMSLKTQAWLKIFKIWSLCIHNRETTYANKAHIYINSPKSLDKKIVNNENV